MKALIVTFVPPERRALQKQLLLSAGLVQIVINLNLVRRRAQRQAGSIQLEFAAPNVYDFFKVLYVDFGFS